MVAFQHLRLVLSCTALFITLQAQDWSPVEVYGVNYLSLESQGHRLLRHPARLAENNPWNTGLQFWAQNTAFSALGGGLALRLPLPLEAQMQLWWNYSRLGKLLKSDPQSLVYDDNGYLSPETQSHFSVVKNEAALEIGRVIHPNLALGALLQGKQVKTEEKTALAYEAGLSSRFHWSYKANHFRTLPTYLDLRIISSPRWNTRRDYSLSENFSPEYSLGLGSAINLGRFREWGYAFSYQYDDDSALGLYFKDSLAYLLDFQFTLNYRNDFKGNQVFSGGSALGLNSKPWLVHTAIIYKKDLALQYRVWVQGELRSMPYFYRRWLVKLKLDQLIAEQSWKQTRDFLKQQAIYLPELVPQLRMLEIVLSEDPEQLQESPGE